MAESRSAGENRLTPDPEFQRRYEENRVDSGPELFEDWMVQHDPTHIERESVLTMTRLMENHKSSAGAGHPHREHTV